MRDARRELAAARECAELLEELAWWEWFDAQTLERGIAYEEAGRVGDDWKVSELDGGFMIFGQVAGSESRPYTVRVIVMPGRSIEILRCTCPVGHACKHAVALLEAFTSTFDEEAELDVPPATDAGQFEASWRRSLDRLASLREQPRQRQVPEDHELALFLDDYSSSQLTGLKVAAVWLRPSRSPGRRRLVDPKPVQAVDGSLLPAPAGGWDAALEERLVLLLSGERAWVPGPLHWFAVRGSLQVRALSGLLADGDGPALFHKSQTGQRLAAGPRLTLRTHWREDASGGRRIAVRLEGADGFRDQCRLHQVGERIWYLDPERLETGPVDGALAVAAWAQTAPVVPLERIAWVAGQLQQQVEDLPELEAPRPPKVVEVPSTAPSLVLRLEPMRSRPPSRPHDVEIYGCAVPSFAYGDHRVPVEGEDRERISEGDLVRVVNRDRKAEQALLDALPPELVRLDELLLGTGRAALGAHASRRLLALGEPGPVHPDEWGGRIAEPARWWRSVPQLRRAGMVIEVGEDFPAEPERVMPDDWDASVSPAGGGWFDLALDVELEGERVHLLPLLRSMLDDPEFPLEAPADEAEDASWEIELEGDRVLVLPLAKLRPLLAPIVDWLDRDHDGATLRLPAPAATDLSGNAEWRGPGQADLAEMARTLAAAPDRIPAPRGLVGALRDYQAEGVAWLRRTSLLGVGGVLADDMGLGKTIQVLAHVLDERERRGALDPVLVVCPTSLVANWCAEAARFSPGLNTVHLQLPRAERLARLEDFGGADLVVTTYALLVRDLEALQRRHFSLVVLDEAQAVKNPRSQTAIAARRLDAERRLAITGTPLENHLGELWSQLDLVAPGFLGAPDRFGKLFRSPIERRSESGPLHQLRRRIAPLLLRRTREEVLGELPAKTESVRSVTLTGAQRDLYESLRLAQHERVRQAVAERGLARSGIVVLDALLKLRQACCDPRLVKLASAGRVKGSAKLAELRALLATLLDEDRRVLVFSQFTEMLALIADVLDKDAIPYEMLTGQVPGRERKQRIERFQNGDVPVFLISLRAGGTGLNLTAADTVIHYDPWWNPAIEAQATGRAHRMGQRRPVHVYRLVAGGTVEERIAELQARKAELAASLLAPEGAGAQRLAIDEAQLDALFAPVAAN